MGEVSTPNELTSRRRGRPEADRRRIEETAARELARLGERLSAIAGGEPRSIETDTETDWWMRALLPRAWLRPVVTGPSPFLGINCGSWAALHWLWRSSALRIEALARLNRQAEEARRTLGEIEETMWGVTPQEIGEDRFSVLPFGTPDNPPWTVRERPAVKPSRE